MNFNRTNHHRSLCALSACLIATFGLNPSVFAAGRIYVDGSLSPCGDGIGWGTAYKYLQDALNEAVADDEIWVAAGWYYVDQSCANEVGSGQREDTFQLVKDVFLLGGFNGTETLPEQRDPVNNITILSGMVDDGVPGEACPTPGGISCFVPHLGTPSCDNAACCDVVCGIDPFCCFPDEQLGWDQHCVGLALVNCGEAFHVVTAGSEIDDPVNTVIDGFEIRDGWANGPDLLEDQGGGMLIRGEPSVIRCTFQQNTASAKGGGMSMSGNIQPWIINSIFEDNPGDPANPGDQQVIPQFAGGLVGFGLANPILTNCLFVGNAAKFNGGAILIGAGSCPPQGCAGITLVNCTLVSNTADTVETGWTGGGLYAAGSGVPVTVDNCIFWDNSPDQIDGVGGTSFVINYSDIMDGWMMGTGNLNVNPLFVNAPDDLRLTIASLCIDAGNPDDSIILDDIFDINDDGDVLEATPDLDLSDRVLGSNVDMGPYESCTWDLDGDCSVGVSDLLILLAAWGTDPGGPPDFNDDGEVGTADLLLLLANWGLCPCGVGAEPLSLAEELADACLSPANWDDFVAMMGDPNASQEDKDRFYCWMVHYLDHCNKCTCQHIPRDANTTAPVECRERLGGLLRSYHRRAA